MYQLSYRSGGDGEHLGSEGYLKFLDQRLGFPKGTLYDLCRAAVKSETKTGTKPGVTVTYRGETERQIRTTSHRSMPVRKAIFLLEFTMTKAGKQIDRVVQVHLELEEIQPALLPGPASEPQ
jgi:hypothetical protein